MLECEIASHSGIKDMKWGVRRYQNYDGTLTEEGKLRYRKEKSPQQIQTEKERQRDAKNASSFTKEELVQKIEKIQLEKRLKSLTAEEINPIRTFFNKILVESSKKAMTTMATGAMLYLPHAALTKSFSIKDFAESIAKGEYKTFNITPDNKKEGPGKEENSSSTTEVKKKKEKK